jgi:DNA polymerase III, alpha subunit
MEQKKPLQRAYAELHCTSNFSFLQGGSHPDELVVRAAELGYAALAITDRMSLAGIVRAHGAAKTAGIPLIIGAVLEVQPMATEPSVVALRSRSLRREGEGRAAVGETEGRPRLEPTASDDLVVWVHNRTGYANLCRLLTAGHAAGGVLHRDEVAAHAEGLLAGVALRSLASAPSHAPAGEAAEVMAAAAHRLFSVVGKISSRSALRPRGGFTRRPR